MPLLRALPVEWRNLGVNFLNTACLTFLRISAHLHFCWTEVGAELAGVAQSLIVTCRLHDIDPYDYLVDVLQRVGQHPASEVAQLTPRLWKQHFAANCLRSDLLLGSYNIAGIFQYYLHPGPSDPLVTRHRETTGAVYSPCLVGDPHLISPVRTTSVPSMFWTDTLYFLVSADSFPGCVSESEFDNHGYR